MNKHGPSLLRDQFLLAIRFLPRTGKGAGFHVWPASYDDQDRMAAGATNAYYTAPILISCQYSAIQTRLLYKRTWSR